MKALRFFSIHPPLFCFFVFFLLSTAYSQTSFTEVSLSAGVNHLYVSQMRMGGGVAFFDYDRDGDEDLVLSGGLSPSALYRNDLNGQFTDVSAAAGFQAIGGIQTMGVVTGDIDNDGYREIYFTTHQGNPDILLYNNGDGTFTDITISSGIAADTSWGTTAAFGDVNLDGLLDIYVANYLDDMALIYDSLNEPIGFNPTCLPNFLFINQGNLTFVESSGAYGVADSGCGLATAFSHTRPVGQGGIDLLIANDHGMWNIPNKLYHNNLPAASFSDVSAATQMDTQMYGMGIAVADYDHDVDLDYYMTNIGPNRLFNNQNGTFYNVAAAAGVQHGTLNNLNTTGWGTAFFDADNDGWQDLFVANGYITVLPFIANTPSDPDKLFLNMRDGTFSDITNLAAVGDTGMSRGMAFSDYDQDGDVDLAVASIHYDTASSAHTLLYRNELPSSKHFIALSLEGTISNRDAYGARIVVNVNGQTAPWMDEVSGGNNHMSQNSTVLHIGLDSATTVDRIDIFWPNGGYQPIFNIPADTFIHVIEDSSEFATYLQPSGSSGSEIMAYPNPSNGAVKIVIRGASVPTGKLTIRDLTGRQIVSHWQIDTPGDMTEIDLTGILPDVAGMYLVEYETPFEILTCKLIRLD